MAVLRFDGGLMSGDNFHKRSAFPLIGSLEIYPCWEEGSNQGSPQKFPDTGWLALSYTKQRRRLLEYAKGWLACERCENPEPATL